MAARRTAMAQEKGKPTVETVQPEVKISDLLMYEVCTPLREQLDKIKICNPYVVVCIPNDTQRLCNPDQPPHEMPCQPIQPPHACPTPNLLRHKLVSHDIEILLREIEELKREIEHLKSKR